MPGALVIRRSTRAAAAPSKPAFDPQRAWNALGCVGCHGDDGPFRDEITGAIGKPATQVGRWIRNAPSIKPDTDMPCFESAIDVPDSEALAAWVLKRAERLAAEAKGSPTAAR